MTKQEAKIVWVESRSKFDKIPARVDQDFEKWWIEKGSRALGIAAVSVSLLERAASLVGNPGTNISGGINAACYLWQKDYERWRNER